MNPLIYFEIPVSDMARARLFYERVFKVQLEARHIDGNEMALFPHAEGRPGASGALACGASYVPGKEGVRVYFGVADVAEILDRALSAGGRLNYPMTEVPDYGWVAEFIDSEGNCIALFARTDSSAGAPQSPAQADPLPQSNSRVEGSSAE